jgi:hypothetical protein
MELFEFLEAKRENIVIQRARGSAQKRFKFRFTARGISVINNGGPADMPSRFAFNANRTILTLTSSHPPWIPPFNGSYRRALPLRSKPNRMERTNAISVLLPFSFGPWNTFRPGPSRVPVLFIPDAKTVNMDVLDLHKECPDVR